MALYAIGDLHLSFGTDKPMEVFGGDWAGHIDRLRAGFAGLSDDDTVMLCGDLSWALNFNDAREDFAFIHSLPGKKILLKGNHDYFWTTASKMHSYFTENGWSFDILHNNCHMYGDVALCGTRGWSFEDENSDPASLKVYKREVLRLEASLIEAKKRSAQRIFVFLHYPPLMAEGGECPELLELLDKYCVERCYYGHLHGAVRRRAFSGKRGETEFRLVSADELGFAPLKIL